MSDEARRTILLLEEQLATVMAERDAAVEERDSLQLTVDLARDALRRGDPAAVVVGVLDGPHQLLICELHPESPWPHDECDAAGVMLSMRVPFLVAQRRNLERTLREHDMQAAQAVRLLLDRLYAFEGGGT